MFIIFQDKRSIYGAIKNFKDLDTLYTAKQGMLSLSKVATVVSWMLIIGGIGGCMTILLIPLGLPMILGGFYIRRKNKKFKITLEEVYQEYVEELSTSLNTSNASAII